MYQHLHKTGTGYKVKKGSFIDTLAYATAPKDIQYAIKSKTKSVRLSGSLQSITTGSTSSNSSLAGDRSVNSLLTARSNVNARHRPYRYWSWFKARGEGEYATMALEVGGMGTLVLKMRYNDGNLHLDPVYNEELCTKGLKPNPSEYPKRALLSRALFIHDFTAKANIIPKQQSSKRISCAPKLKKQPPMPPTTDLLLRSPICSLYLVPSGALIEKKQKLERGTENKTSSKTKRDKTLASEINTPKLKPKVKTEPGILHASSSSTRASQQQTVLNTEVNDVEKEEETGRKKKKDKKDSRPWVRGSFSYDPAFDPLYKKIPRRQGQHFLGEMIIDPSASQDLRVVVCSTSMADDKGSSIVSSKGAENPNSTCKKNSCRRSQAPREITPLLTQGQSESTFPPSKS